MEKSISGFSVPMIFSLMLLSQPALAYVGPGLGLGAIGAVLGVIFSVFLAIFAIFWYPIKRLLGIGKRSKRAPESSESPEVED